MPATLRSNVVVEYKHRARKVGIVSSSLQTIIEWFVSSVESHRSCAEDDITESLVNHSLLGDFMKLSSRTFDYYAYDDDSITS